MFELSKDHEDFRAVVREFAEAEVVAAHRAVGPRQPLPGRPRARRWATSASSVSSCRRSTAAPATAATSRQPRASRSRSSAASTSPSASRSAPGVGLGINPILTYGSEEQKERFLPDLVAGRALAGVRAHRARRPAPTPAPPAPGAARDGDEWVVNGAKAFITNSGTDITSVVTVTARTGTNDDGSPQIQRHPGARRHTGLHRRARPTTSSAGTPPTPTASPSTDAASPRTTSSASAGQGFAPVPQDPRRRPHRDQRARRRAAPRPASSWPPTTRRAARRSAARSGPTRASPSRSPTSPSWSRPPGRSPTRRRGSRTSCNAGRRSVAEVKQAAAVAKLYSTEAAVTATRIATQVFGGNGFMEEYPVARFYRDAKILEIGEGTSEVQRMVIARGLGPARMTRPATAESDRRVPSPTRGSPTSALGCTTAYETSGKHHADKAAAKLDSQDKIYVRDRIGLLFDEGSLRRGRPVRERTAAGSPGRRRRHRSRDRRRPAGDRRRQRPHRQGRLVGRAHRREDRAGHRDRAARGAAGLLVRRLAPAPGSPTRSRCSPADAARGGSSTTRWRCPARCRRSAASSGPVAAGGAYIPRFYDIVIMVEGNASMYLGSPRMAEMVVGETVSLEEMGGARMHCTVSGLRRPARPRRRRGHRAGQALLLLRAGQLARRRRRPTPRGAGRAADPRGRCPSASRCRSTSTRSSTGSSTTDSLLRDQAAVRRRARRRVRPDGRRDASGSSRTTPPSRAGCSSPTAPTRRPGSSGCATPSRSRWSTSPTCRAS